MIQPIVNAPAGAICANLAIIGSGPAGLTAAVYAARASLAPLVFEGSQPGGQLTLTTEVENFPGFAHGVMGPELMAQMKAQAERFGAQMVSSSVESSDLSKSAGDYYLLTDQQQRLYAVKALIIATGASAKFLGLPGERALIGRGVSTCATCDGFFFRDKIVHVVGGGDTAMEDANFIAKFAKQVFIIHRKDSFRASKPMQQRTFNNPKIKVIWNSTVTQIISDASGVTGIEVTDVLTGNIQQRPTDGLFYAIGHTPNTSFLKGQLELDEAGFLKTQRGVLTSKPGIFACGDVQDPIFRQAITAAGSGCQAAMMSERYLEHG